MRERLSVLRHLLVASLVLSLPGLCFSAEVAKETARQVAENFMQHHVATHGDWAGSTSPSVTDVEVVKHENSPIAYNVRVSPAGHLLVPYHDEFSPVLLYSDTSDFIPTRVNEKHSIESWIIPEISSTYKKISRRVVAAAQAASHGETKVAKAWRRWKGIQAAAVGAETSTGGTAQVAMAAATVVNRMSERESW